VRIYLPVTLDELDADDLPDRRGHAVTAALRAALPDEDDEGLEFAAQLMAADDSFELLRAAAAAAPRLRVVASVDVPDAQVEDVSDDDDGAPSLVRIARPVGRSEIACVHVDEPAVAADVAAALAGDASAVERVDDADLLWYDASEVAQIPR